MALALTGLGCAGRLDRDARWVVLPRAAVVTSSPPCRPSGYCTALRRAEARKLRRAVHSYRGSLVAPLMCPRCASDRPISPASKASAGQPRTAWAWGAAVVAMHHWMPALCGAHLLIRRSRSHPNTPPCLGGRIHHLGPTGDRRGARHQGQSVAKVKPLSETAPMNCFNYGSALLLRYIWQGVFMIAWNSLLSLCRLRAGERLKGRYLPSTGRLISVYELPREQPGCSSGGDILRFVVRVLIGTVFPTAKPTRLRPAGDHGPIDDQGNVRGRAGHVPLARPGSTRSAHQPALHLRPFVHRSEHPLQARRGDHERRRLRQPGHLAPVLRAHPGGYRIIGPTDELLLQGPVICMVWQEGGWSFREVAKKTRGTS